MDQAHKDRLAELEAVESRDENQESEYQSILAYKKECEATESGASEEEKPAKPKAKKAKK